MEDHGILPSLQAYLNATMEVSKEDISKWFSALQGKICAALEQADGKGEFVTDAWERPGGGGGVSKVLTNGNAIEKGGVNFSAVWGKAPEAMVKMLNVESSESSDFFATGVSIVMHPHNPWVPIIHMNVRYFELSNGTWWFGGGIDLTPHYILDEDARHLHATLKAVCAQHHTGYYAEFKKWADDYFFIRHRNETRGVGGIFFDYLKAENGFTKESRFAFVRSVGDAFAPLYIHLIKKNNALVFGDREKRWQALRRGRYVEFNLVWDRGTRFGLETEGRTESILMSLPPEAQWVYNYQVEKGSAEERTVGLLRKGVVWV